MAGHKTGYDALPSDDKLRVNAVILKALESGEPKGIISAFQQGMRAAAHEVEDARNYDVKTPRQSDKATAIRSDKFQSMLGELRDSLAKPEVLKNIPALDNRNGLVSDQQAVLRGIRDAMAVSPTEAKDANVQASTRALIRDNQAATIKSDIGDNPVVKQTLVNFMARQSTAKKIAGHDATEVDRPIVADGPGKGQRGVG